MSGDQQQPLPPSPPELCVRCGERFKEGAIFCEKCGAVRSSVKAAPPTLQNDWRTWAFRGEQYSPVTRRSTWRRTVKAVMAYMMISVILSLIAGLIALVYGVGIVAPDILDDPGGIDEHTLFIVVPVFIDLFTLSGYALFAYYLLIIAAIIASCSWVFFTGYKVFMSELTMKAEPRKHSQIFEISGLIFVEMFALFVVVMIAVLLGISETETGVTGTTSELLFLLANASVWEELIVRVLMIGLPLLVIDLAVRKGHRKWKNYILGGGFSFGTPEVALLAASAVIFGCAHYIGGWEAWVVPWDALGGITFGYLFLRHGLAAAIVLHFAIDYRAMPAEVFGFSESILIALMLVWMALGAVFTVYYLLRVGEFFTGKKYLEEHVQQLVPYQLQPMPYPPVSPPWSQNPRQTNEPSAPPNQAAQQPAQPQSGFSGGYICPYCGYTEARWVDGRFKCLRCNRLA